MKILIVAEYLGDLSDPSTYNSRFLTIADMLADRGHEIKIVTTDFIHGFKKHISGINKYKNCELITLHEPGYNKNICLRRFWSHYILSKNLKKWLRKIEKPDVIYCAIPSLDFAYEAARYAKHNGIKYVVDIQDLWPEAFKMVVNFPGIMQCVFLPFRIRANYLYAAANEIVGVSQTYVDRALKENKSCKEGLTTFLGTDLSKFDQYKQEETVLEKKTEEIWLGYVGTLGHSYDLKTIFDSINSLKNKEFYKRLSFIVIGDGPLRKEFEHYADSLELRVSFLGNLPYSQMVAMLSKCDIAVNPIKKKSAGSIINKHGDYAAAGIAVLNTQESPEYRKLVEDYGMGLNCQCEDYVDVAEKLTKLLENKGNTIEMGKSARKCAEERFDRRFTYQKIIRVIENDRITNL